jgi:hypothetical protein
MPGSNPELEISYPNWKRRVPQFSSVSKGKYWIHYITRNQDCFVSTYLLKMVVLGCCTMWHGKS